jgi:class 3 adenylate cyclase
MDSKVAAATLDISAAIPASVLPGDPKAMPAPGHSSDEALIEAVLIDEAKRGELLAARVRAGVLTATCVAMPVLNYIYSRGNFDAQTPAFVAVLAFGLLFSWVWLLVVRNEWITYRRWHSYATVVLDVLLYSGISAAGMSQGDEGIAAIALGSMPGTLAMFLSVASAGIRQCRGASQLAGGLSIVVYAALLWRVNQLVDLSSMGNLVQDYSSIGMWAGRCLIFVFTTLLVAHASKHAHSIARRTGQAIGERERITSMFGRYVDQEIANEALAGHAGGETREVTVLFTDLRNFTAFSEPLPPAKVLEVLNAHFAAILPIVHKHGGVVNKFIGDAIMATFGAPHRLDDHAQRAVQAALEMQREMVDLNTRFRQDGMTELQMGVGIATGPVVIGELGDTGRSEYAVIGDTVNTASRLEGLNKEMKTGVLLTSQTRDALKGSIRTRALGEMPVKGKALPVAIFTVDAL